MELDLAPALVGLTHQERIYVQARLRGLSQRASAAAAGYLERDASKFEGREQVQKALATAHSMGARAVGFTLLQAHDMLMDAYTNADTAGEQIAAVRELVKLHGLEPPKQVEHTHHHRLETDDDARQMSTAYLEEMAALPHGLTLEGEFKVIRRDADGAKEGAELRDEVIESPSH